MPETTPPIAAGDQITWGTEGRVGTVTKLDTKKRAPGRHWRIRTLWGEHLTFREDELTLLWGPDRRH